MKTTKLFVYGTLKQSFDRGAGCKLLGVGHTKERWTLIDFGAFPAMIPGNTGVKGELWEIPVEMLTSLDRYEGVPSLYQRMYIEVRLDNNPQYEWVESYVYVNTSNLLSYKNTMTEWVR